MSLTLTAVSALADNYIWVLANDQRQAIIIDPGEAAPILAAIKTHRWQPKAILLTHHHADHVGGVAELVAHYPDIPVYGPEETRSKGVTKEVVAGESIELLGQKFMVIATPGHTLGHVVYYAAPYLFSGDTLFSGGCGRLFEGSPEQMFHSLQQINQLPKDTIVCCAHEYTESNLKFAHHLLPNDQFLADYYQKVQKLRANQQITLPTTLETERLINLFLKSDDPDIRQLFASHAEITTAEQRFAALRRLKDSA